MAFFPAENLATVSIVVIIEQNVAEGAHSFNALLNAVRNWRGFGYRFEIIEHPHKEGSITEEVIGNADELWFFGTELCEKPEEALKLTPDEIALIQKRMNEGVGVFATGDHEAVGWGLCGHLPPRVANMRNWGDAGAPSEDRPWSYESTIRSPDQDVFRPELAGDSNRDEPDDFDVLPKPVWVLHLSKESPHELMQLPVRGVRKTAIRFLPDHMHEGKLHDYAEKPLSNEAAALVTEYKEGPFPQIVARSVRSLFDDADNPYNCVSYPVVSAYEAAEESLWGNIVVDSTFHHWTDQNALRLRFTPAWLHIEQYAINVANWLLGKAGRKKVEQAVVEYIRKTGDDGAEVIRLLDANERKQAIDSLRLNIAPRMIKQRIVSDTLERILLGRVISTSRAQVEAFARGFKNVDAKMVSSLDETDRQRFVLGLRFEEIRKK
ncbi:hypothetical protein [Tahibacter harae]|uniref:ThuA-like domain-containing protein n=1 Tax=Tahibacter harae TaxID=2963937 RepID=A0ABT1QL38_9GAMM|nr:hypothetical protein [Tahibacter harae]MCQ4163132.1 hypothetical protein [Tahibacter harae]